jgi:hypothetical protein
MTWAEILVILEDHWAQFQKEGVLVSLKDWNQYGSRDSLINEIVDSQSKHRKKLDQACFQFANTRKLPALDREQAFWFFARLHVARSAVKFFLASKRSKGLIFPNPDDGVATDSILEYLLVNYWYYTGKLQFLGEMIFQPPEQFDPLAQLPDPEMPEP